MYEPSVSRLEAREGGGWEVALVCGWDDASDSRLGAREGCGSFGMLPRATRLVQKDRKKENVGRTSSGPCNLL